MVPRQIKTLRVRTDGEPVEPGETTVDFEIVAETATDHGSAMVTLVTGFKNKADAEVLATEIRNALTNSGQIDEYEEPQLRVGIPT